MSNPRELYGASAIGAGGWVARRDWLGFVEPCVIGFGWRGPPTTKTGTGKMGRQAIAEEGFRVCYVPLARSDHLLHDVTNGSVDDGLSVHAVEAENKADRA